MSKIRGTAIIRDRGQLTIPEKIREVLYWPVPNSVVSISVTAGNEILIKPFESKAQVDWSSIWLNIGLSRSAVGKKGNLSEFISSDRGRH